MSWEMVRGHQWPPHLFADPSEGRIRVTRNKLFGACKQIESLMMDMMPEGFLVPEKRSPSAQDMAEAMRQLGLVTDEFDGLFGGASDRDLLDSVTRAIQAEHEHRDEHLHLGNLIGDMVTGGRGVEKIFWNAEQRIVDAKQLYPLDVAIDPDCRSKQLRGAKFIVVRRKVDLEDIIENFDPPKRIVSQLRAASTSAYDRLFSESDMPIKEMYDAIEYPSGYNETVRGELTRDKVEFFEVYYLGERSFDADHGGVPTGELSSGRVISVADGLDEPLYDGENPDPGQECPIVFYDNYGHGHSAYPHGEVEPNLGNQIALNILMSAAAMNAVLNQNAQWLVEEGAIVGDDPSNRPGGIFEVAQNKIGRVQRLPGIEIPSSMFALMQRLDDSIADVLNVNDTTLGGTPQTHTPAYALQMAQTMNLARMRQKGRSLEASWRRRTRLEANLVIAYAALLKSRGEQFSDLGEYLRLGEGLQRLKFDVKVVSKTERPIGFIGEMQFAFEAFDKKMIDRLGIANFVNGYPIDPELKQMFEMERENARITLRIQNATLRQQESQMGLQGAPQQTGSMAPTVSAGAQPAAPEQVAQAPMPMPAGQPAVA